MEGDDVLQSLKTGKYSADRSCWDTQKRFLLRLTFHGTIISLLGLILLQVVLMSIYYHNIADAVPVTITPYGSVLLQNSTLAPCVFPRHNVPLPGDIHCPTEDYCPIGWTCSIVADEDTQINTFVCLNSAYSCGDLHFCTNYISGLDNTSNTTVPAKISDIQVSETGYYLSVVPIFFSLFLLAFMWIVFTLWSAMVGDPLNPNQLDNTAGVLQSFYEKYQAIVPSEISTAKQCGINILVMLPISLIILIGGIIFLSYCTSPSLNELTLVAASDCFEDHWLYLFSSSMLGWITGFFVAQILCLLAVLFFLSLYTIKPLFYGIWDARVFLTIMLLMSIIIAIGVTIELTSILIMSS